MDEEVGAVTNSGTNIHPTSSSLCINITRLLFLILNAMKDARFLRNNVDRSWVSS